MNFNVLLAQMEECDARSDKELELCINTNSYIKSVK